MGLVIRVYDTRVDLGRSVGRHRRDFLKLRTALLVIAVLSPLWVMPLSAPVVSDVVVVMHHDSAVSTAVRTITANDPSVQVVEYGSLEYALTIYRTLGRVVWVSHGSEDGILAGSQMLSWQAFSSRTRMTPGKDIVLACDSAKINQYVSISQAVGVNGAIDASLGGMFAVLLLKPTQAILHDMANRFSDIIAGFVLPQFLGTMPAWWIAVKAGLMVLFTGIYFLYAEAKLPQAVAELNYSPLMIVTIVAAITIISTTLFYLLQSIYQNLAAFLAVVSPLVNVLAGLAIQRIIGGALPGGAYLLGLAAGRVAALVGCSASVGQPWIRAAFAASAALFAVSIVDFVIITVYTYLT
ncbi:MAG: hypothetical protein K9W43_02145 [Candidatus Thorarchaeota archaeon]|nr:hypothetical protein [Candidatus Thorarchaeota archaeon]